MYLDWTTLALQLINFAILVWLLQRFLYRPVLRVIEARRASVEQQFAAAAAAESNARERLAEAERQRSAITGERAAVLQSAAAEAERLHATGRVQAEHEGAVLLQQGRVQLAAERAAALQDVQWAALNLSTWMLRRILDEFPAALRTQAWLTRIEQYLHALPEQDRVRLREALPPGAALIVATAEALDGNTCELWRTRLAACLGALPAVEFVIEPSLGAGAELRLGADRLRFTLASAIESLHREMNAHADGA